jgi:non-ribosomal peptide synthetase component F
MTLLASFKTLLYRYSEQEDIVVGTAIANRNRSETEALIGFFINTLVLRTDLSGNPSFRKLMQRVRETTLGAYVHQDLPFEKLVEELQPERSLSHTPIFQIYSLLQNAPVDELGLPGLNLTLLQTEHATSKFDLSLVMSEEAGELERCSEYNSDLFASGTITRMAEHFQTLLDGIAADPSRPLSEVAAVDQRGVAFTGRVE